MGRLRMLLVRRGGRIGGVGGKEYRRVLALCGLNPVISPAKSPGVCLVYDFLQGKFYISFRRDFEGGETVAW